MVSNCLLHFINLTVVVHAIVHEYTLNVDQWNECYYNSWNLQTRTFDRDFIAGKLIIQS
jgi:hypothetical protein